MPEIHVGLGDRSYPVLIGRGLISRPGEWAGRLARGRVLVVTNDVVAPLYQDALLEALSGFETSSLVLPDGEAGKNTENWSRVLDKLVSIEAGRDATVVSLGGGVIGDLAGFAAASYMRGISHLQVPTTLLAQVDSSVGGKTAVNHPRGKNLIGSFHQPCAVVADVDVLATLPQREFRAGLAEVVKYGALRDPGFFEWIEHNAGAIVGQEPGALQYLIARCVENKAEVVAADELETGQRALLNLGHSFGHAIETVTAYQRFLHGEAVAIGMVVAARLSESRGLCSGGVVSRISRLLQQFDLPVRVPADLESGRLLDAMKLDKKNVGGQSRLVLLKSIGEAFVVSDCTPAQVLDALDACRE